jgi:hypothetical protein
VRRYLAFLFQNNYDHLGGLEVWWDLRELQQYIEGALPDLYRNRNRRLNWNVMAWRNLREDFRALREGRRISFHRERSRRLFGRTRGSLYGRRRGS